MFLHIAISSIISSIIYNISSGIYVVTSVNICAVCIVARLGKDGHHGL